MIKNITQKQLMLEGYTFKFDIGTTRSLSVYGQDEFRFIMKKNKDNTLSQYLPQFYSGRNKAGLYLTERMRKKDEGKVMAFDELPITYLKSSFSDQKFDMFEAEMRIAHRTIDELVGK